MEYRTVLPKDDFQVLERAVQHGPFKIKGELVWEDEDKKTLTLVVNVNDLQGLLTWTQTPTAHLTSPIYPMRQKPGFVRVRINAKQAKDLWTWKKDESQKGMYEMVLEPAIYLGYQVGEKRLQGWYLKLVQAFKYA